MDDQEISGSDFEQAKANPNAVRWTEGMNVYPKWHLVCRYVIIGVRGMFFCFCYNTPTEIPSDCLLQEAYMLPSSEFEEDK
jgi:hypothetical protein